MSKSILCPDCEGVGMLQTSTGLSTTPTECTTCETCGGEGQVDAQPYIDAEREASQQIRKDMSGFAWVVPLIPNILLFMGGCQ